MTRKKILATVLVTLGILLFMDFDNKNDALGIIFALLSGVFYAFNVIYMDKSGLDKMNYIKLTFYISLFMSISVLACNGRKRAVYIGYDKIGLVFSAFNITID